MRRKKEDVKDSGNFLGINNVYCSGVFVLNSMHSKVIALSMIVAWTRVRKLPFMKYMK